MILRPCFNCGKLIRVDDLYDKCCKKGSAKKKCPHCGANNEIIYTFTDVKCHIPKTK